MSPEAICLAIQSLLNNEEDWSMDTLDTIADLLRSGGYRVGEDEKDPNDCPECGRSFGPNYTGPCEH